MNQYRTEYRQSGVEEILDESAGIQMEKIEYNGGIRVTRIKIISQEAAKKMGKPVGSYITLEADGVLEEEDGIKEKTAKAVAGELGQLMRVDYTLKVLVAGLGNSLVTPDRIRPSDGCKSTGDTTSLRDLRCGRRRGNVQCQLHHPRSYGFHWYGDGRSDQKGGGDRKAGCSHRHRFSGSAGYRQSQHDDPADGHGDPAGKRHGQPPSRHQ